MEQMKQLWEQLKALWQGFSGVQKILIGSVAVITMFVLFFFTWTSNNPTMSPLYTNLQIQDASAITAKLKELNVPYKLVDDGKTIMVPESMKYQLRLDLANQVNLGGIQGFEIFNETQFGATEKDKQVRYLVALQGEITRTILNIDTIEAAKVHIVQPTDSLYTKDKKPATASVFLKLKPFADLNTKQVESIMRFVANSVEGLKPNNVTVMDATGRLLSEGILENLETNVGISTKQIQIQEDYENHLAKSIQSMLEQVMGPGSSVVRVKAELDFDEVEKIIKQYGDRVGNNEYSKEETSTGSQTGGAPGTDTNIPSYQSPIQGSGSDYSLTEKQRDYLVDEMVEKRRVAQGTVKNISVSVIIDGLKESEFEGISKIVKSAAGIPQENPDAVQIYSTSFKNEYRDQMLAEIKAEQDRQKIQTYIKWGLSAIGAIVALGLIFVAVRRIAQIQRGINTPTDQIQKIDDALDQLSPEAMEKDAIKARIEKLAIHKPDVVARVIKTWVSEDAR